jgi:two-component system NtrC family sensor kinase
MDSLQNNGEQSAKFKRIRRMIITRVLIAPFLIVMLVCGVLVYFFADALGRKAQGELSRITDGHRALVDEFLAEQVSALEFTATTRSFTELSEGDALGALFMDLKSKFPAFEDIGVFDEKGRHAAYVGEYDLEGKDYSNTDWFKAVSRRGVYVSDVFKGYRNVPHFVIAVQRIEGGRPWYLRATIDTAYFSNLVKAVRVGSTGQAFIVNGKGVFQTGLSSGERLEEPDPDWRLYRKADAGVESFTAQASDGNTYLYAVGRLQQTGWLLVVRQKATDAYAPLARAVAVAVIVIALGGGVVVLTAYVLASGLAGQLAVVEVEKREMSNKLLAAGKLAEVGEMSAGMAHEINNPLQVMMAECYLINDVLNDLEIPDKNLTPADLSTIRDSMAQISMQISRCSLITQGLLKFARKTDPALHEVDLGDMVEDVVSMVDKRAHIDGVSIAVSAEKGLPRIMSDESQLQQVFLNLLNNALYAVHNRHGAEIRIEVQQEHNEIVVSVADNGCGIEPENLSKIFLPFFTTKPVGQGTGLGLSTCYGIVERLGGRIEVQSEPGAGTVFTVRMPLSQAHAHPGA